MDLIERYIRRYYSARSLSRVGGRLNTRENGLLNQFYFLIQCESKRICQNMDIGKNFQCKNINQKLWLKTKYERIVY